ncbi:family 2 encapsulin nanocompartment cargo protein terpene cyclase [Streptomyces sp. SP17BM10]|uniref:family 2 encapsulin nanocompartment cargo protein terpene cyclase n=1 Tax=Streptomyces sp. SP17BM10 TaxID=3002530 RepID=UPI002E76E9F7|nr:family 2 encapsulin nanocompartment cargo protein terpene cyclase [Streptomyces sp. SP17BM10]MEE1782895.1 family 2 encapsulin nanocompartment cargo protein terpene cyclase [Streptomyces sp. SP17BM10]
MSAAATTESAIGRILRGPTGLGTASLYPTPPAVEAPIAETAIAEVPAVEAPAAELPVAPAPSASIPGVPVLDVPLLDPTSSPSPSTLARAAEAPAGGGKPKVGDPVPGLYHHPIVEPDPVRVEELSLRIKAWAIDEVQLYPPEWEDQFDGFSTGRYMVACHPDAPSVDHLMLAARLMVAENVVDDCYCEDHGGSPIGLGGRLLMAHTALDRLHTTAEYHGPWEESLSADAPRRAYRSAMDYFTRAATPSQSDRFRHDMARLHLGYLAEASWAETDHVPQVWEYLTMRQFNNFRPCPTITDTVGAYELPSELHALPAMQRVIALAGNATTIVNDLYSYTKELASPGRHLNLPVVLAERENLSDRDGYLKAVEVHNELMHAFEAESAALAASCPVPTLLRFLQGVAAWLDGNHYWHQTNTFRYTLPDFW